MSLGSLDSLLTCRQPMQPALYRVHLAPNPHAAQRPVEAPWRPAVPEEVARWGREVERRVDSEESSDDAVRCDGASELEPLLVRRGLDQGEASIVATN